MHTALAEQRARAGLCTCLRRAPRSPEPLRKNPTLPATGPTQAPPSQEQRATKERGAHVSRSWNKVWNLPVGNDQGIQRKGAAGAQLNATLFKKYF